MTTRRIVKSARYTKGRVTLTAADRKWIAKTVRRILAEVIATEARHGGYDGATNVGDDDWQDNGKRGKRKRIGFRPCP